MSVPAQIVMAMGRILDISGGVFTEPPSGSQPVSTQSQVKFPPAGVYMLSVNVNGWASNVTGANGITGGGGNSAEINLVVASIVANPSIFLGYSPQYYWPALDGINTTTAGINTAGPDNDFQTFVAACHTAGVTGYFVPQVASYHIGSQPFSQSAGLNNCVPAYVFNGSTAIYGTPPQGALGAGWVFGQYGTDPNNPTNYEYTHARFDVVGTRNAYITFWQNFGNAPLTANAGPYAGVAYTWNTHPQVGGMVDWTDSDPDMNGSPTTPATWSGGNWNAARAYQAATIPGLLPNTCFALMGGYGANGDNAGGTGPSYMQQLTIVQSMQTGGCGLSASDVFWEISGGVYGPDLTYAQHYFKGDTSSTPTTPTWTSGGTVFAGQVLSMPDVQGEDYSHGSQEPYTQAQVQGILSVAYNTLKAQYVFFASEDSRYNTINGNYAGPTWSGASACASTYGSNGISGAIVSYGPNPNTMLPKNLMFGPNITSVTANSTTGLTVNWSAVTGQGTGLSILLFRNGTRIDSGSAATFTSYTDTGLSPETTYTYTLALSNYNGTGPQGPGFPGTTGPSVTLNANSPLTSNTIAASQIGINSQAWLAAWSGGIGTIVSQMQSVGTQYIRWPGGSTADNYLWETQGTCNGYVNSNATYPNFNTELLNPLGVKAAITVNYGSSPGCSSGGSPSYAAAWVANNKANGYGGRYWTVGNEVYGSWEYDLHPMKNDPTTYANAVAGSSGFYALMKAADSSAQVGVVVTGGTAYNNWDGKVLGSCPYDFVEFHYYPQNSGSESDAYLLSQTSGAIPSLQTSLNNIKSEVAAAGKSGTPIMVGEFNSVNTNPGKQTLSIVNALFVGMAWGTMLSNDVRVITIWSGPTGTAPSSGGNNSSSLYGWQNFGDYDVICGSSVTGIPAGTILPSGIAMQLIAKFAAVGGQMLATTVNGATNVVAFGASNGAGGYNALLFNLSESVTATVVLTVESPSKGSFSGTAYTYDKALYDNSQSNVWSGYTTASLGTFANGSSVTLPPWSMTVVTLQ